jgi:hypothetical protein
MSVGSFVGSQQGSLRYLIEIDDTPAQQKLNQFKNGLGIFNNNLNTSSRGLGTMAQQMQALGLNVDRAGNTFATAGGEAGSFNAALGQMNQQLGPAGQSFGILAQNLGATQGPLQNFGTGIQTADANTTVLTRDMGALSNAFKPTQGGLDKTNTLMGGLSERSGTLGSRLAGLKSKFSEIGIGVSATMSSAINMARAWRDLEDSQIQVDKAMRKQSLTQEAVTKATEKLAIAQNQFGANSRQAAQAELDLNQALENNRIQLNVVSEAQERHDDIQTDFWLNSIPTIIGTMATMTAAWQAVNAKSETLTKGIGKLRTGFTNLRNSALLASPALASVGTALGQIAAAALVFAVIDQVQKNLEKMNPTLAENEQKTRDFADALTDMTLGQIPGFKDLQKAGHEVANMVDNWINSIFPGFITMEEQDANAKEAQAKAQEKVTTKLANALGPMAKLNDITKVSTKSFKTTSAEVEILSSLMDPVLSATAAKTTKEMNNVSNEMLGLSINTSKSGDEFANTSFEVENLGAQLQDIIDPFRKVKAEIMAIPAPVDNAAKNFQDLTHNSDGTVKSQTELFKLWQDGKLITTSTAAGFKSLEKGTLSYNEKLDKNVTTSYQAAAAAELLDKTLSGTSPTLKEANEKFVENSKAIADAGAAAFELNSALGGQLNPNIKLSAKQMQDAIPIAERYSKALTDLKNPSDLFGKEPFKIKFDADKRFDKLINNLGGDLETNIKLTIKSKSTDSEIQKLLTNIAKTELNLPLQFKTDDTEADKFVGDTLAAIKKAYQRKGTDLTPDPNVQKVINKLVEIQEAPDSWTKLTQYFNSPEFLATMQLIDPLDAQIIASILAPTQAVSIPIEAKFDIKNMKTDKGKKTGSAELESGGVDQAFSGENLQIEAKIVADNKPAFKAVDAVAKRISTLTNISPAISLLNNTAIKTVDVVAKRINSLESIKPQITLLNNKAFKSVDAVAKRIMSLENLKPVIKVKFTGEGKLKATGSASLSGSGSIKIARHGLHEVLSEDTTILAHKGEKVDISPFGGAGQPNFTSNREQVGNAGASNPGIIQIFLANILMDRQIIREYNMQVGKHLRRF